MCSKSRLARTICHASCKTRCHWSRSCCRRGTRWARWLAEERLPGERLPRPIEQGAAIGEHVVAMQNDDEDAVSVAAGGGDDGSSGGIGGACFDAVRAQVLADQWVVAAQHQSFGLNRRSGDDIAEHFVPHRPPRELG